MTISLTLEVSISPVVLLEYLSKISFILSQSSTLSWAWAACILFFTDKDMIIYKIIKRWVMGVKRVDGRQVSSRKRCPPQSWSSLELSPCFTPKMSAFFRCTRPCSIRIGPCRSFSLRLWGISIILKQSKSPLLSTYLDDSFGFQIFSIVSKEQRNSGEVLACLEF